MAYAEEETNSAAHPPYPEAEMILSSITDLGEKDGSTKLTISKQIEAVYGNRLPEDHSDKLSDALDELKEAGKLVFIKNGYATPRRGRGRPPKVKPPLSEAAALPSPKQSSHPQKESDPLSTSTVKKRGRPKLPKPDAEASLAAVSATPLAILKRGRGRPPSILKRGRGRPPSILKRGRGRPPSILKRGRGRPPKVKPPLSEAAALPSTKQSSHPQKESDPLSASTVKKRGRPKLPKPDAEASLAAVSAAPPSSLKRGRGRQPKVKPPLSEAAAHPSPKQSSHPQKESDPLSTSTVKKRGRPKLPKPDAKASLAAVSAAPPSSLKRGRGRPPKAKPPAEE